MHLLQALWWMSLVMANGAFASMIWLVIARVRRSRAEATRETHRRRVMDAYMGLQRGDGGSSARLIPHIAQTSLLAETLLEFLDLVRGAERDRLIDTLRRLNIDERFRAALRGTDESGKIVCAEALVAFPCEPTRLALEHLAESPNKMLHTVAFRSLLDQGAHVPVRRLVAAMSAPGAAKSRLYADLLRRLAMRRSGDLAEILAAPQLPASIRAMIADALGAAGDYRVGPGLIAAASSQDPLIRSGAVRGLGHLGHPIGNSAVVAAMNDSEWTVRADGLDSAAKIGSIELIPLVAKRLDDDVWSVRVRAAEALARFGREGKKALRDAPKYHFAVANHSTSPTLGERAAA